MTLSKAIGTPPASRTSRGGPLFFLRIFRKHWVFLLGITILGGGVGALVTRTQTKVYQASTLLEIDPAVAEPLGGKAGEVLNMGAGNYWDIRDYYETQYKVIGSDRVLGAVVRNLGLAADASFVPAKSGRPPTLEDATQTLRARLTVELVRDSRLVRIGVEDFVPARAKKICDAIAQAYIDLNLQTALSATSDAVVWLNGQLDHIKTDLERDENALYAFKQQNDLPSTSINETSNMLRVEMQEFDTALTHTRTRRAELMAREAELSRVSPDDPTNLPASELLGSTFLQSVRTQYEDARKEKAALEGEGKGPNHPLMKRADERIAIAKAALLAEVKNIQGAVQRDLAIVLREEGSEAALFEATRRRAVDLNMKEIEYHRLDRTREENEKLFGMLLERTKEADLARMMKVNNIRVIDVAAEPRSQVRPRLTTNLAFGLLLGLAAGLGLAWLREQLDSSLRTPDDV